MKFEGSPAAPPHYTDVPATGSSVVNVGDPERALSAVGGGLLTLYGLRRGGLGGYALAALGGALVQRGVTGHCQVYGALGMNAADYPNREEPVEVIQSVTVNRPRADVYAYWRQLENLPRFMEHLQSVTQLDDRRSRWEAKGPGPMPDLVWEAEIVVERPGEVLAWQSLPGAAVDNAGHVRFEDAPGGGTEVHVRIGYRPPAGAAGAAIARRLDAVFGQMVKNDVGRFKNVLEAGAVPTTEGQPRAEK